ncbi:homocysteine S-methyltransferase 3-like [Senna tora]|uniref:Homocysteine S-methyltransferase 3-like n=1 Tax=Senna tora TaxID=362788 RepID=A0A834SSR4_9FABA|nr:homocysteine S-methyltransferase 3-like [Senna tora]
MVVGGKETTSFMSGFLEKCGGGGYGVLDGGFATELERHGADLNDPLWSAKCLLTSPHLVRRVHLDYLDAGANIITTASYQATIQGFEAKGFSREEGEDLLRKSVKLAREARDIYNDRCTKDSSDFITHGRYWKRPILIAASVGSYGAYLADGSEYRGDYGDAVTVETLKEFHRKSCRDESNVASGDSISECASIADSCKKVVAVGVNCTAPRFIQGLISSITKVTSKPVLVYPNSGETYDAESKQWVVSS